MDECNECALERELGRHLGGKLAYELEITYFKLVGKSRAWRLNDKVGPFVGRNSVMLATERLVVFSTREPFCSF